ncbi:MAG: hypothetical protein ABSH32_30635 [Bryobacteraceae bacterium]
MTIDERLEKLAERHEALTQSLELLVHRQADAEERQIAAEERHEREMADIRREAVTMRTDLRRAFAMGVREARTERSRRRELDEKIGQVAAAQLITEEKVQALSGKMDAFIDSMRRGGNGNPQNPLP